MKGPILYIDDEQANLDGLKLSLKKEYDIIVVDTAEKGLAILSDQPVKVILCDQRMPLITGVEFFALAMKLYPQIPRILVTGYSDPEAIVNAINEAKIFHYISKPWQLHDMRIVLDNAIEQYDLKQENESLVSNLLTTNQELSIAKDRAEESDRLKSAFLANLSHEIRTPMNGIIGFASLLSYPDMDESKKGMFITEIIENSNELLRTFENIYQVAMIETNQVKYTKKEFGINKLLSGLEREFRTEAGKKNLEFKILNNLPDYDCEIHSDPELLSQAITQLVRNAFKFTDAGSVELGYLSVPGELIFFVKDTGCGIEADKRELIFERFKKAEPNPEKLYGGIGLGLAITKSHVAMMGGKIWLESEFGKGSQFYFSIPRK